MRTTSAPGPTAACRRTAPGRSGEFQHLQARLGSLGHMFLPADSRGASSRRALRTTLPFGQARAFIRSQACGDASYEGVRPLLCVQRRDLEGRRVSRAIPVSGAELELAVNARILIVARDDARAGPLSKGSTSSAGGRSPRVALRRPRRPGRPEHRGRDRRPGERRSRRPFPVATPEGGRGAASPAGHRHRRAGDGGRTPRPST